MRNDDWLTVLQEEVDKPGKSQNKVAKELGISPSKLSQTLRGVYPGSTEDIRLKVEGKYMSRTVACPVKGEIPIDECSENQQRPFSSANRERVRLYKACRSGCPYSSLDATAKGKPIEVRTTTDEVYRLDDQLAYLRRTAKGDSLRLNELLEAELSKLATRYNQLLWSKKYSRSEQ
ncbi:hypothetical protein [Photobacterium atrarenae]|uniref:HTH cro/C1-type domain-containing protein n=1 Tax=Photobacterium atrarenae TaxID=865757 RepID=A0ABY5GNQ7_9GAMM|nr:hypothetical protein [Photobacterium atrarenae]UTV30192.1 hypothetical protein NNL38_16535 [Photobacterium atrarenae]